MPTLIISGPAQAFANDPRGSEPITDPKALVRFHGLASEEECVDAFDDRTWRKLGVSGGRLRFVFDKKTSTLRITTAFQVRRPLTEEQTQRLVEATKEQWSDGIGSGSFENFSGEVLSTALAMALQNSGDAFEDIGEYFVDAYPLSADDKETQVEFQTTDDERTDLEYLQEAAAMASHERSSCWADNSKTVTI